MKLLKEPLVHFLLIGIGLFIAYGFVNSSDLADADNEIVVSAGRIEQLATVFAKTWQRPPTPDELKGLIDDFVLEEVYYRQAKAMEIDNDDTIIRRRLRQKLEFLTDDTASLVEPTEKELIVYLADNDDRFRQSPTYTFQQVYFNPEKHTEAEIADEISFLQAGKQVGDVSLLPTSFEDARRQAVDGTFGTRFSEKLDDLKVGDWQGPVRSGLGFHLIKIDSRTEGRLPELDQIRQVVEREWSNEKRLSIRKQMNDRLLGEYEITIEWPTDNASTKKTIDLSEAS
ncbi:MAG: hypothetical protein ACI814_001802 [Mariniblastus sp.]|jgi:hypothetical protein